MRYFTLFFLFINTVLLSQTLEITIEINQFGIDNQNNIIVSHVSDINQYADLSNYTQVNIIFENEPFQFVNVPSSLSYSDSYLIEKDSNAYQLYFTELPLILINTTNEIIDEPKVATNFIFSDNEQVISSIAGIELRGGFSQTFPKKTYDLEFWTDETGNDTQNFQINNLRNDDDWVLDALYNEPLRIRTYIAHKLWLAVHNPHYLNEEENAKSGADVLFIELFLNTVYTGVYLLSEQVDKKQLKLKSYQDNIIRGELYKGISWGASTYTELPNYDNNDRLWSGFEIKYPKESQTTNWENLYGYIDFVMNSDISTFENEIWNKFNKENCIDYFLFINLIRATDNLGKNIYLAKYDQNHPYFNVPWDLDGNLGTIWNGTNDNTTTDILQNGLYYRLLNENPNNFHDAIKNRWLTLRATKFSLTELEELIDGTYNFLQDNNIYDRESIVFPNYSFDEDSKIYINNWLHDRINYLDNYFNTLAIQDFEFNNYYVYPVPSNNKININFEQTKFLDYTILSKEGKSIKKGILDSNNAIDVSELIPGIYFLYIENFHFKIIKN